MSEAAIKRAAEEAEPNANIIRKDGDLFVHSDAFNISKFVRFLALQPHVVSTTPAQGSPEPRKLGLSFIQAMDIAEDGLRRWREKDHNKKWWRKIDGTPIPNDLLVNIAESMIEAYVVIAAQPPAQAAGEPVAWRVLCTTGGATGYLYTEALPFEPGPGVTVRRDPEPVYAAQPAAPVETTFEAIHDALKAANLEYSAFSTDGVVVFGDKKSIEKAATAFHSHSQIDYFREQIRHWREECGKLHARLAAAAPQSSAETARLTAWLVEWPQDDNVPVRWWNPATGWMRDANKAMWFARESDANDYIAASQGFGRVVKATEHAFFDAPAESSGQEG